MLMLMESGQQLIGSKRKALKHVSPSAGGHRRGAPPQAASDPVARPGAPDLHLPTTHAEAAARGSRPTGRTSRRAPQGPDPASGAVHEHRRHQPRDLVRRVRRDVPQVWSNAVWTERDPRPTRVPDARRTDSTSTMPLKWTSKLTTKSTINLPAAGVPRTDPATTSTRPRTDRPSRTKPTPRGSGSTNAEGRERRQRVAASHRDPRRVPSPACPACDGCSPTCRRT